MEPKWKVEFVIRVIDDGSEYPRTLERFEAKDIQDLEIKVKGLYKDLSGQTEVIINKAERL